jgi:hypothetical protein
MTNTNQNKLTLATEDELTKYSNPHYDPALGAYKYNDKIYALTEVAEDNTLYTDVPNRWLRPGCDGSGVDDEDYTGSDGIYGYYTADAMDADGCEYFIIWPQVIYDALALGDESGACDWDNPIGLYNYQTYEWIYVMDMAEWMMDRRGIK